MLRSTGIKDTKMFLPFTLGLHFWKIKRILKVRRKLFEFIAKLIWALDLVIINSCPTVQRTMHSN